jgi:hypothetical protein
LEFYDKIEEKKNWFEKTDCQKAEKWKLQKNEVLNKNVAVGEWRTIVEELEEKHEDVLSRLQVISFFFYPKKVKEEIEHCTLEEHKLMLDALTVKRCGDREKKLDKLTEVLSETNRVSNALQGSEEERKLNKDLNAKYKKEIERVKP